MAAAAVKAPTNELGAEQWASQFSPPILDDHETNQELAWPLSVQKTYPNMLNDAHVEGMDRGVMYPIRAYDWYLNRNGARPEVVDRISADYNLPVGLDGQINQARSKRRFIFDEHLEDVLRAPAYGHGFFEQVYDVRQDGNPSLNAGWLAHLRKLAYKPPRSIIDIQPATDGGLDFIRLPAASNARKGPGPFTIGTVDVPVDRLVAYVWDREGSNWAGRSMLRSCYRPWKLKDRVIRVGAINIERAGGLPYVVAPDGATPKQMEELHLLATMFRVGETAGAALPYGAQLKFASAAGGDQAIEYVKLMNEEMARAWVQMLMMLGQTQTGSRALGDTFSERADLVQQAIAQWVVKVFSRHVIEDDVDLNEGPGERYAPLLAYRPHGDPTDALAGALDDAQVAGALPADSAAAAAVKGEQPRSRRRPKPAAAAATPPTEAEQLQASYQDAIDKLTTAWADVQTVLIDDVVGQVAAAATVTEMAAVAPTLVGGAALVEILNDVLAHGAQTAVDAAQAQGVTLDTPDLIEERASLRDAADATAGLLARSVGESAASRATGLAGGAMSSDQVAADVREHLEGLAGQTIGYELAGLTTRAQNEGRFAAMAGAPDGTTFEASDLNDTNTCEPCRAEDGTEFESLAAARLDFPAGQFLGCEGGKKCRCAIVALYPETEGQA